MRKARFIVLVASEYLRDQQVCKTENTEDDNAWVDISIDGFLGIYEWTDAKGLLTYLAKKHEISSDNLRVIEI